MPANPSTKILDRLRLFCQLHSQLFDADFPLRTSKSYCAGSPGCALHRRLRNSASSTHLPRQSGLVLGDELPVPVRVNATLPRMKHTWKILKRVSTTANVLLTEIEQFLEREPASELLSNYCALGYISKCCWRLYWIARPAQVDSSPPVLFVLNFTSNSCLENSLITLAWLFCFLDFTWWLWKLLQKCFVYMHLMSFPRIFFCVSSFFILIVIVRPFVLIWRLLTTLTVHNACSFAELYMIFVHIRSEKKFSFEEKMRAFFVPGGGRSVTAQSPASHIILY